MEKIIISNITYEIDEYLGPANVLICSRSMTLGHLKRQCTQINETCRICEEQVADLKNYNSSEIEKSIHCQQSHKSNSLKCPMVKSFRSELIRKLLHLNNRPPPTASNNNIENCVYDIANFPPLTSPQALAKNPVMNKFGDLIGKMTEVKDHLTKLALQHDKFEQFMLEKKSK